MRTRNSAAVEPVGASATPWAACSSAASAEPAAVRPTPPASARPAPARAVRRVISGASGGGALSLGSRVIQAPGRPYIHRTRSGNPRGAPAGSGLAADARAPAQDEAVVGEGAGAELH